MNQMTRVSSQESRECSSYRSISFYEHGLLGRLECPPLSHNFYFDLIRFSAMLYSRPLRYRPLVFKIPVVIRLSFHRKNERAFKRFPPETATSLYGKLISWV